MTRGGDHDPHRDGRASARPGGVDPEGPLSPDAPPAAGGRRLSLRPSVEPFAGSDGHVYVLKGGSAAEFVVRDAAPRERALLAALDGAPVTVAEIAARMGEGIEETEAA